MSGRESPLLCDEDYDSDYVPMPRDVTLGNAIMEGFRRARAEQHAAERAREAATRKREREAEATAQAARDSEDAAVRQVKAAREAQRKRAREERRREGASSSFTGAVDAERLQREFDALTKNPDERARAHHARTHTTLDDVRSYMEATRK